MSKRCMSIWMTLVNDRGIVNRQNSRLTDATGVPC